ncbi:unnamed protein product [Spirodela intermedia]|uniref:Uncharacterized protein n=1 Tax=Spirodela intermedia TaxID=51605 RepID=A0A7I8LF58_SPIIN|nr:unnamed protein product [Spirodela intermedia]
MLLAVANVLGFLLAHMVLEEGSFSRWPSTGELRRDFCMVS